MSGFCKRGDCTEPARYTDLCEAHYRRQARGDKGDPIRRPESPLERLRECALTYADADSDDEGAYARADSNLKKAAWAFALSQPRWEREAPDANRKRPRAAPVGQLELFSSPALTVLRGGGRKRRARGFAAGVGPHQLCARADGRPW